MVMGSSFSDFAFKSLSKNLTHRSRVPTLYRNNVPFSSLLTCSFLAFFFLPTLPYSSGVY